MMGFVLRRLVHLVGVVFGITVIVFLLVHIVPGNPAEIMLGTRATPERVAQVQQELGLDRSLIEQYWIFVRDALHGDLGHSYFYQESAASLVFQRLGATLFLTVYSAVLAVLISVPLALVAALRRGSLWDHGVRSVAVLGLAVPSYWLGTLLLIVFAAQLGWFPVGGYGASFSSHLYYLALPALTVSLTMVPIITRALRTSLTESLQSEFVDVARSKGLSERRVVVRHALRTALTPAVAILGVNIGFLVGGLVVIEAVFGIPGVGDLIIKAISTRDYPVVQAATLILAVLVVIVNAATDLATLALDPRARTSAARVGRA